ncbi:hypothetical protein DFH08DRAFT_945691 [Mycena albidolilacea]|uniref:F-box domain-containing protein n=1 Tax=Mycena albidolilacea TaxID=1033008 RepID=A0AAD6YZK7_9AGAR|nr:hypothetical protein DFH08DRAFT_945691 [Mycena albidolilacea]
MSSQADQLRMRISDLQTEIDLQRKLLRKLEDDKILAQRQLNAVLDPVARLPLEISSEIFLQSLDAPFPEPGALHISMLLLSICSAWTDIALATPALWVASHITFPCALGLKKLLPIRFKRAHNRSLSVSLSGVPFDQDVLSVIWKHGQQLQHFEMRKGDDGAARGGIWRLWEGCSPGPLPSLQTLAIRGWNSEDYIFSFRQISELLHMSPNLTECILCDLEIVDDAEAAKADIVLPKLRRLIFGEPGDLPFNNVVFNCLSLPGLEVLSTSLPDKEAWDDLLSFLKRSSPPLRELTVKFDGLGISNLPQYLCLVPDLRRLEVWWPKCHVMEGLFAMLAESPSLVPNLDTLVIHDPEFLSGSFWTALSRTLAARRTQLHIFRLEVSDPLSASEMPAPSHIDAFRELAVGGTRVHIKAYFGLWEHAFY